jgi:hypothetical protein
VVHGCRGVGTLEVVGVDTAVLGVGITAAAVVGTSAADPLRPHTSVLDASQLDMGPVCTSRLDIGPMYASQVDTAGISGMAVGGITALAHAGYGRNITASTCGSAIKVLQSCRRIGDATASRTGPPPVRDFLAPSWRSAPSLRRSSWW